MNKYQNLTFNSTKDAIAYHESLKRIYGFNPELPIIKVSSDIQQIPKGLIIEVTDETENSYVLNPFYGMEYYVFLPKQNCKKIC